MKRGIWIAIAVGIVLILIAVVVILSFVPLGPPLSIASATATSTSSAESSIDNTLTTPTVPAERACRSGTMVFMALGESQPPRGTDAIRLVKVDFDNKRIDMLSLPAELWVGTPGLADRAIAGTTLNDVYYQGKTYAAGDERDRMLAAVDLFAGTLQANFGFTPEHYFVIKQNAFAEFVDALNGVDVVLPVAVDGRSEGMAYFPAGTQHLTGAMALDLVRISGSSEADRVARQELVIQSIYQSLLTPQNWSRLPELASAFVDNIFTDFSVDEMLDVSCVLDQIGVVVNQQQVGSDLTFYSGTALLPKPELAAYIQQVVGK